MSDSDDTFDSARNSRVELPGFRFDPDWLILPEDRRRLIAETADYLSKMDFDRRIYEPSYYPAFGILDLWLWPNVQIEPELQDMIASHMDDPVTGFSPRLKVSAAAVDCLGRPLNQPEVPDHVQIGAVGHGKAYLNRRKQMSETPIPHIFLSGEPGGNVSPLDDSHDDHAEDWARFEAVSFYETPENKDEAISAKTTQSAATPAGHTLEREDPYQVPPGANLDTYWKKPDTPN